jgi:hypothetical protein
MAHANLIVEDGTIVPNADSFVTQAEYVEYAGHIGAFIDGAEGQRQALRKAAIYMASFEGRLKGSLVDRDQSMPYPRSDLVLEGFEWADDEIPRQVKLCQMQLALDLNAGIDIYNPPQSESVGIKSERVEGAVAVEYAVKESSKLSRNSTATALMASLLEYSGLRIVLERS